MTRSLRNAGFLCAVVLASVPAWGQSRTVWRTSSDVVEGVAGSIIGTVVDVNEAGSRITVQADEDRYGQIQIDTDSVSTQYNGFGDVINGKPEIFTGSRGFANVREGDRLEIRGVGRAAGVIRADTITLLGRTVPAPQTGVGVTRSPAAGIGTPTVGSTATMYGRIEGVVRDVDAANNRIVVETDRREIFTVRTTNSTPVTYRGDSYQVSNLEPGDRVRIDSDGSSTTDREIRARTIEVTQGRQDVGGATGARVSTISGRVTRIDRTADVARIDTGRGETRIDMSRAYDANGRRTRAADLQIGDRVDLTGSYAANSNVFTATTVRFVDEDVFGPSTGTSGAAGSAGPATNAGPGAFGSDLVTVTLSGTVTETLANSPTISVRDRTSGRVVPVFATEDFAVRTKSGGYTTADHLNVNDSVLVKAYRDADGNYIAQTIRMR